MTPPFVVIAQFLKMQWEEVLAWCFPLGLNWSVGSQDSCNSPERWLYNERQDIIHMSLSYFLSWIKERTLYCIYENFFKTSFLKNFQAKFFFIRLYENTWDKYRGKYLCLVLDKTTVREKWRKITWYGSSVSRIVAIYNSISCWIKNGNFGLEIAKEWRRSCLKAYLIITVRDYLP